MKVSVICNTCNRGEHLRRLLIALSKQTYEDFEVVVVNGPSTDNTAEVTEKFKAAIKYAECPVMRLGVSRNIGISQAAGDILAFIDDDAVPGDKDWLRKLVSYYEDPRVGGAGGPVYSLQGGKQFENGYVSVWGVPFTVSNGAHDFNDSRGQFFNYVMGCNCSFRRQAVDAIRGFDEYYDYFHDESDLSLRIIKAGYKIIHCADAFVFHELATGHIRRDKYHLDWHTIVRSQAYFAIKNAADYLPDIDSRIAEMKKVIGSRLEDFQRYFDCGYITKDELAEFRTMWEAGVAEGTAAALHNPRILLEPSEKKPFKKFEKKCFDDILNVILLCENFNMSEPTDGICAYTARLAKDLADMGHSVHVVTGGKTSGFSLTDGVNVHLVNIKQQALYPMQGRKTLRNVVSQSYAFMRKIVQLSAVFSIDIVEAPLWNSLGYAYAALSISPPLCVRLETPLKMVMETQLWKNTAELDALAELEKFTMRHADGILHISDSIKNTIEEMYQWNFKDVFTAKNYLGIEPIAAKPEPCAANGGSLRVFFVGRLERRKGIHTLLAAIPDILAKHPNTEFRIAGDDAIVDREYGETFKARFLREAGKDIAAKVKFLGKISGEGKEKELQACDIFVSPSLYESFGIIFLEAMRYGKPSIGCNIGGMKEIIEDGDSGLLAEPGNAEDLAQCMDRLLSNPALRRRLGDNARKRIREKFNNRKQAQETVTIYRQIIRRSCRKRIHGEGMAEQIMREFLLDRPQSLIRASELAEKDRLRGESNICADVREEDMQYIFPWKLIPAGSKVVMYGGGAVGKTYLRQLEAIPYCHVVAVCDKQPQQVGDVRVPIITPSELAAWDKTRYDKILIAVLRKEVADEIGQELCTAGIAVEDIVWADNAKEQD